MPRRTYGKRRRGRGPYAPARVKKRIGEAIGTDSCRATTQISESAALKDYRSAYDVDITNVVAGSGIDNRDRGLINLRGWRFRVLWKNLSSKSVVLNYCIISPKVTGTVSSDGLMRTYNTSRDANLNTLLTGVNMAYNPISTDKWNIILHKRKWLLPGIGGGDLNSQRGSSYHWFNKYVPLKRQVRFNDDGDENAESGRTFFLWWTTAIDAASGAEIGTNELSVSTNIVTFWKNPKYS